jgi:hypothetical protein
VKSATTPPAGARAMTAAIGAVVRSIVMTTSAPVSETGRDPARRGVYTCALAQLTFCGAGVDVPTSSWMDS